MSRIIILLSDCSHQSVLTLTYCTCRRAQSTNMNLEILSALCMQLKSHFLCPHSPRNGRYVTIQAQENSSELVLCEVMVSEVRWVGVWLQLESCGAAFDNRGLAGIACIFVTHASKFTELPLIFILEYDILEWTPMESVRNLHGLTDEHCT